MAPIRTQYDSRTSPISMMWLLRAKGVAGMDKAQEMVKFGSAVSMQNDGVCTQLAIELSALPLLKSPRLQNRHWS